MKSESVIFTSSFIVLSTLIKQTCSEMSNKFQLTYNELCTLNFIYTEKPDAVKHISERLCLTKSHTSKVLSSLEKKGLIERELNNDDKRNEKVSLTEKGLRVSIEASEFIEKDLLKRLIKSVTDRNGYLIHFSEKIKNAIESRLIQSYN